MKKPDPEPRNAEEDFYKDFASSLLKRLQRDDLALSDKQLATVIEDAGLTSINVQSLNNKINRGTYSFSFALHVLAALGVKTLDIPPLPPTFTLRITPRSIRQDQYKIPGRISGLVSGTVLVYGEDGSFLGKVQISSAMEISGLNAVFQPAWPGGIYVVTPRDTAIQVSYVPHLGLKRGSS